MKTRLGVVSGSCFFCFLLLTRCNLQPSDDAAGRALIQDVQALSRHFVQVSFAATDVPVGGVSRRYVITGPYASPLAIRSVTAKSNSVVLLETESQAPVTYQLVVETADADGTLELGATSFIGSIAEEFALATAIPLSSSQVLVVFESPARGTLEVGDFAIGGLGILAVTLNDERIAATLTTTLQSDDSYRVELLGAGGGNDLVVHPLRREAWFWGVAFDDQRSPTVKRTRSVGPTAVLVEFTEKVTSSGGELTDLFAIRRTATSANLQVLDATWQLEDTHLFLSTGPQTTGAEYELRYEAPEASDLSDLAGNPFTQPADYSAMKFVRAADPGVTADDLEPRVVGAFSTSNTSVRVAFNKPMGDTALNPVNYVIVTSNVNAEAGALTVSAVRFVTMDETEEGEPDRTRVELTTLSQSTVEYTLRAIGLFDTGGNALGPSRLASQGSGLVMVGGNETTFFGAGASGQPADTDGDGLSDAEEQIGWVVEVFPASSPTTMIREVTSDPTRADTDEDGLGDAEEKNLRSDPRDLDTDDEGVSDEDEARVWGTSLTRQDTDGDAIGLPLNDARELMIYKTSPRFADTDGDGLLDGSEILSGNRDPRIANLPGPGIEIGEVALRLDTRFSFTDTQGESSSVAKATSATLSQSDTRTYSTSDTATNRFVTGVELEVGFDLATKIPTFKGTGSFEWTRENTFSVSKSSAIATQEQFQESLTTNVTRDVTQSVTRTVQGASVEALVTVNNRGDIAFTMRNIELTALLQDPFDRTKFLPVASLLPASRVDEQGEFEVSLGPLLPDRGPFVFKNTEVFPSLVEDLMKNPRGLIFKVANFDVEDEAGRNLAFVTQEVDERTAGLTIDYGNGQVDRYRVSTHSSLGPDGRPRGVTMRYALQDILGMRKNEPVNAVVVGDNGCAETFAVGDDVQVVVPLCPPVAIGGVIIRPGPNAVLDSAPVGDDHRDTLTGTTIVDGGDGCAHTRASRDDIQVVHGACETAQPDGIVVSPGPDGVFQTAPAGDDERTTVTGYATEGVGVCDGQTDRVIQPGPNGVLNTPRAGDDVISELTILPGPNGVMESSPEGDDLLKGPGSGCRSHDDCPGNGRCKEAERLVRVKGVSDNADESRFWILLSERDIPVETNFDDILLKSGDLVTFAYIQDKDGDGLTSREEFLYGSSDSDDNSDGCPLGDGAPGCDPAVFEFDTIRDFDEVRRGWSVNVEGASSYFAFTDPVLPDTDADRLFDDEEQLIGSDPARRDTDGDEIRDDDEVNGYDVLDRADELIRKVVRYQSAMIGPGPNGVLETILIPDDVTGHNPSGLPIITAGANGLIDSRPDEDDEMEDTKLILDGGNGVPETPAADDDVQVGPEPTDEQTVTVTFVEFEPGIDACDDLLAGEFTFDLQVRKNVETSVGRLIEETSVARFARHAFRAGNEFVTAVRPTDEITIFGTVRELDGVCGQDTRAVAIEPGQVIIEPRVAGNGVANSQIPLDAEGHPANDDIQEVAPGAVVAPGQVIVSPGKNGVLETAPAGDDVLPIGNGFADTLAIGDDLQERALAQPVDAGDAIVSCGPNGNLETLAAGLPGICPGTMTQPVRAPFACSAAIVQDPSRPGFAETSVASESDDVQLVPVGAPVDAGSAIVGPGADGVIDSVPAAAVIVEPVAGNGIADTTAANGSDDVQLVPVGNPVLAGQMIVAPGPDGVLQSALGGDDEALPGDDQSVPAFVPPGLDCEVCPVGGVCVIDCTLCETGACSGDDVLLVRRPGTSCEDGFCPCGSCVSTADFEQWAFSKTFEIFELGASTTEIFLGSESEEADACFAGARLTVRIEVTPGATVEPGAVLVRSGANGELDTQPQGDDIVGAVHLTPFATDPLNADTDGDTLSDGAELTLGANANNPLDASEFRDSDLDGLANIEETRGWFIGFLGDAGWECRTSDGTFTEVPDPLDPPTECVIVSSDRFEPDTDFDGLPDLLEHLIHSDPREEDTDGDGLLDLDEFDPDSRFSVSISTFREFERRCSDAPRCRFEPVDAPHGTSVVKSDTDGDGRSDHSEIFEPFVIHPCVGGAQLPRVVSSSPVSADADRDGVNDGAEEAQGTDPNDPDTDDDGKVDQVEVDAQPDGCGRNVSVVFKQYEVGDDCDFGGDGEYTFSFNVWLGGTEKCAFNSQNGALDDSETFTFPSNECRFLLREGERFAIRGTVKERDSFDDEVWDFVDRFFSYGFSDGDRIIRPQSGDRVDSDCLDTHKLTVGVTSAQP